MSAHNNAAVMDDNSVSACCTDLREMAGVAPIFECGVLDDAGRTRHPARGHQPKVLSII